MYYTIENSDCAQSLGDFLLMDLSGVPAGMECGGVGSGRCEECFTAIEFEAAACTQLRGICYNLSIDSIKGPLDEKILSADRHHLIFGVIR